MREGWLSRSQVARNSNAPLVVTALRRHRCTTRLRSSVRTSGDVATSEGVSRR